MKHIKIIIAALLALTLTACSDTNTAEVSEPLLTETTTEITTTETQTETTMESTTAEETVTSQVTTEEEVITTLDTEETVSEDENDITSKLDFFDYKFIENYQGTTDIGKLADKATAFLMESEYYSEAMKNAEDMTEQFAEYFDNNGKIIPKLNNAYPEDYDGDGKNETFIIIDMPYVAIEGNAPAVRSFLVFADSNENMNILSNASSLYDTILLDYGDFKQITFGGAGQIGADDNTVLYGVTYGNAVELLSGRNNWSKMDCFLTQTGWMSDWSIMFFNTQENKYCELSGVEVEPDEIRAMDTENSLSDIWDNYKEGDFLHFNRIGKKYYVVITNPIPYGDEPVYICENGRFERIEDPYIGIARESDYDIDFDKAIAKMKPVK